MALLSSGVEWLDAEIGGWPSSGVVAALGTAGAGKTVLALASTVAALRHGRTCLVTNDAPETVLETSRTVLEHDLAPDLGGDLTLLTFAPFFVGKARGRSSVAAPLAELSRLLLRRRIEHVVFDTIDPMLTWIDAADASAVARAILAAMDSWGVSVLCTTSGAAPAASELARRASGCLELGEGMLRVRHATWCEARDRTVPLRLIHGRGLVVPTVGPPAEPCGPQSKPWRSLIGDGYRLVGADEREFASLVREMFGPESSREVDAARAGGAPLGLTDRGGPR